MPRTRRSLRKRLDPFVSPEDKALTPKQQEQIRLDRIRGEEESLRVMEKVRKDIGFNPVMNLDLIIRHVTGADRQLLQDLRKIQMDLNMVRLRLKEAVKRTRAKEEYEAYTDGWLTAFCTDPDQPGSIESLMDTIASKYVDEDGKPWED